MPLFPDVDILKGGVDAVESSGYDLRVQVERCSGGKRERRPSVGVHRCLSEGDSINHDVIGPVL